MKFVGIDLHKETISVCVVGQDRDVLDRRRIGCRQAEEMEAFFKGLGPFAAVVEATASYEWLVQWLTPLAQRVMLAHPKKLRVIAESTRKSDRLDAQILAEFLALDMIPEAYRPTPRRPRLEDPRRDAPRRGGNTPLRRDRPPPRAQENVRRKARPDWRATAEMGRSTDIDGERERARTSAVNPLHRRLDKHCFIDAPAA